MIINDPALAKAFLDAWNRLVAAGNDYPASLVTGNSTTQTYKVDNASITPWFVKTSQQQDLAAARERARSEGMAWSSG